MPDLEIVPEHHREDVFNLFSVWSGVRERNASLSRYFDMKNDIKNLGISIPPQLTNTNCVVGWCEKAVHARVVRSKFDGYVSRGGKNAELDALTLENDMRALYKQAATCALTHGLAAMTVMKGGAGQPPVKVRVLSANQFACIWDKSLDRIRCGIALHDVDDTNTASAYVAYFDDCVMTFRRGTPAKSWEWSVEVEPNPMGRPLMEVLVNAPHPDHPLGRSLLTPELRGIVDKAMRDVLRMEIGAEFFTFPQRYILGAADDLFAAPLEPDQPVDEDGDLPQVGQFSAAPAENFTAVFENDAQRFSGATNVPLGQLGVLSNTYTSSDALGAANDPLILDVEEMHEFFRKPLAEVGRMMLAIAKGKPIGALTESERAVEAYFADPSMPTIAARADAWTKLGAADQSIVGTRVYYEGVGLSQQTIDRLMSEKQQASATQTMGAIAQMIAQKQVQPNGR